MSGRAVVQGSLHGERKGCLDGAVRSAPILVIDVGSSSVRGTIVEPDGSLDAVFSRRTPPARSASGTVEIDAEALLAAVVDVANAAIATTETPPAAVSIATQRASTVLFDAANGRPIGPAISWQDVRTTGQCLTLASSGVRLQPSQSATKLVWLLAEAARRDGAEWRFGTLDSFLAFGLSNGAAHVTDVTNAAVTGLVTPDGSEWDREVLALLSIPEEVLPEIVDSVAPIAPATMLRGAPLIAGLVGDQQASLIGQACLGAGDAKVTFGTGGMLDLCLGRASVVPHRGEHGTFPIVAWRDSVGTVFGLEGIVLSAGSCIDWLVDSLGVLASPADSEAVASSVRDAGGVTFVPALGGLGTPLWDHGARGALLGISSSTTRGEVVRAVLEGIAHRGRDLLDAIEADGAIEIAELHVDGGMSNNGLFVQLLANATGRPVLRAQVTEATTVGAAMLGGVAAGIWPTLEDAARIVRRPTRIEPNGALDRSRWLDARERSLRSVPALSMLTF